MRIAWGDNELPGNYSFFKNPSNNANALFWCLRLHPIGEFGVFLSFYPLFGHIYLHNLK